MKTSFKLKLNNLIKERFPSSVSIQEIEQFCKQENRKLSNAERRLRNSESPDVLRIYNNGYGKSKAIIGYVWNGDEKLERHWEDEEKEHIEDAKKAFADFEKQQSLL